MTDHPITPPPELVQQWIAEIWHEGTPVQVAQSDLHLADRAAQWGADQELRACCEWLADETPTNYINALRAARRPKPQITLDEALNLVKFEFIGGEWRVKNVNGDVYGIVEGILHGTINGRTWQFVETPKAKLKRLISKGADKAQLLEAFNQLEVN